MTMIGEEKTTHRSRLPTWKPQSCQKKNDCTDANLIAQVHALIKLFVLLSHCKISHKDMNRLWWCWSVRKEEMIILKVSFPLQDMAKSRTTQLGGDIHSTECPLMLYLLFTNHSISQHLKPQIQVTCYTLSSPVLGIHCDTNEIIMHITHNISKYLLSYTDSPTI